MPYACIEKKNQLFTYYPCSVAWKPSLAMAFHNTNTQVHHIYVAEWLDAERRVHKRFIFSSLHCSYFILYTRISHWCVSGCKLERFNVEVQRQRHRTRGASDQQNIHSDSNARRDRAKAANKKHGILSVCMYKLAKSQRAHAFYVWCAWRASQPAMNEQTI